MTGWILTIVFAGTGAWFLGDGARPGVPVPARISGVLHGVLAAAMIAMVWPWGMQLPVLPQLVGFGLAGVWFLATSRDAAGLHHAAMAAGMAWMVIARPQHGPHHVTAATLALAGYFALATLPWLVAALRRPGISATGHAVLSGGMCLLLALPAAGMAH